MARSSSLVLAGSCALFSACIDVPRPARPTAATGDASFIAELASDASLLRPPAAEPYTAASTQPAAASTSAAAHANSDAATPREKGAGTSAAGAAARSAAAGGAGSSKMTAVASGAAGQRASGAGGSGGTAAGSGGAAAMPPPPARTRRPSAVGEIVITEIMSNPAAVADTDGEWLELYNPSAGESLDLGGCTLDDGGKSPHAIALPLVLAALSYATIARSADAGFTSNLALPISLSNDADAVALVCDGVEIDRVAYGAGFPLAAGASMSLDPLAFDAVSNDLAPSWCLARSAYGAGGDRGTPGEPNPSCHVDELDAGAE